MGRNPTAEEASDYYRQINSATSRFQDEDKPACETCGGLGYIRVDLPVGHPKFGQLFPCPDKTCPVVAANRRRRYEKLNSNAQIPDAYKKLTFAKWDTLAAKHPYDTERVNRDFDYMHGKWDALGAALAFVNAHERGWKFNLDEAAAAVGLPNPDGGSMRRSSIVFSGLQGVGKTSLAISIANWCLAHSLPIVYTRLDEIFDALKRTFKRDADEAQSEVMRFYQEPPILIIDEFTPEKITEWRKEIAGSLINYRYTHSLPTIITTNTSRDEFPEIWGMTCGHRVLAMAHWIVVGGLVLRPLAAETHSR